MTYECPWCGREFTTIQGLKQHVIRSHLNGGPGLFYCPACHRKFTRADDLRQHIRYAAIWALKQGLKSLEAREHMALAYLISSCRSKARQVLRSVWRQEYYALWGNEGSSGPCGRDHGRELPTESGTEPGAEGLTAKEARQEQPVLMTDGGEPKRVCCTCKYWRPVERLPPFQFP